MTTTITITNLRGNLLDDGAPTSAACDRLNSEIKRAVLEVAPTASVTARVVYGQGVNVRPVEIDGLPAALTNEEHAANDRVREDVIAAAEEGYDRWISGLTDDEVEA